MKMLLSTSALLLSLGVPNMTRAQETQPSITTQPAQPGAEMLGFLATRGQSDVFVSELMGHDVHARRVPADMAATSIQATANQATSGQSGNSNAGLTDDGTHSLTLMNRGDLNDMDNIGQINEIILSSDGQVRALVIGVGGFLGMGEQDVAVTMDQVTFASDPDDPAERFVVVNTGAEMLKAAPAYDRTAMLDGRLLTTDGTKANAAVRSERTAFAAPKVQREGYERVEVTDVTAEMIVGREVYGVNDNSVGTIDDLILDEMGLITNVIIDFGGFLGMGTSQVSVGYDELTILANEGRADVRVYVDATKEQVQAQPPFIAGN